MGHGVAVLLTGVLPFELVIPGQLLFYFLLSELFHLPFRFDLFLTSSSFGADLQNTNLILIIWPSSKKNKKLMITWLMKIKLMRKPTWPRSTNINKNTKNDSMKNMIYNIGLMAESTRLKLTLSKL